MTALSITNQNLGQDLNVQASDQIKNEALDQSISRLSKSIGTASSESSRSLDRTKIVRRKDPEGGILVLKIAAVIIAFIIMLLFL